MGTPSGPIGTEDNRVQRTNKVLADLLKDGRAEVSDLTVRDVARLANELGWKGEPRFEFTDNGVFISPPGRKRRAATQTPATPPAGAGG